MNAQTTLLAALVALGAVGAQMPTQARPSASAPVQLAQAPLGDTYTTVRRDGGVDIQTTSGNQRIYTTFRQGENSHVGQDRIFMLSLIPSTGHVTIYSAETGETFYDYYIEPVNFDGPIGPSLIAQSSTPTTYMTQQGPDTIIIQITDGSFYFRDEMYRGYGNTYQATDHGIRVNYDGDSGRVTVISNETGAEFYNYFYTGTIGGSGSTTSSNYGTAPPSENYINRVSDNEYSVELIEGQFYFNGSLYRSSGDVFVGSDGRFRVMYNRGDSRVLVINLTTGEEIFNYIYSEVNEGYL